ncbi:MAG TPA: cysteine desulfurase family protein [Chloroflexia bacterium]|nr:cysteine desulfurase family protein [Chloroflexia bacterium]
MPVEKRNVYLDHAATTPVDPAVVEAMLPVFNEYWGNPSSLYERGRDALNLMETARAQVAGVLNCKPSEIVFNSGGSEGDNLALKGVALQAKLHGKGNHIITTAFEHHAVLHAAEYLEEFGIETTFLPVSSAGLVDPQEVERAIRPGQTALVSIIYANNEIGTMQPLAEIARITRQHGILFHTDAVQAAGNLPLDVQALGVDLLSLSSHKFYGPKGVGIFYVRQGVEKQLLFQQQGGSQERKRRAGTENVPYIVGTAKALTMAEENRPAYVERVRQLRDRLLAGIQERIPGVHLNGTYEADKRLANNINLCFEGIGEDGLLQALDLQGISASSGSACNSGAIEPSHVLKALGTPDELALGTLRLTLGKGTTAEDVDYVLDRLPGIVSRMRALSELAV